MRTTKELLKQAKKLIDKPQKWCRGTSSIRNRHCAVGAIWAVSGFDTSSSARAERSLLKFLPKMFESITEFNDASSHKDVMKLFAKAIR